MHTLAARFWAKVRKTDGCWLWTDKPHAPWGYGRLYLWPDRREIKAHRLSWILHFGPVPEGLGVLHKCDTPLCVRPDHLFLGTVADNVHDCVSKGRHANGNGPKTHCPRGHAFDASNTYEYANGRFRGCRACRKAQRDAYRQRRREQGRLHS